MQPLVQSGHFHLHARIAPQQRHDVARRSGARARTCDARDTTCRMRVVYSILYSIDAHQKNVRETLDIQTPGARAL